MEKRPLPPDVQAPPILRVAAIDRVIARRKIQILPVAIRLVGLHAGPANLRRQQPADRQRRVAHPLRLEAGSALPRVLAIIRVSRELRRRRGGNLPVRRARDDHAHELFHVPAGVHKFAREPIEQRTVGRRFALCAEIARHPAQRRAEKLFPQPIRKHPRGERIFTRDQPTSQIEPGEFTAREIRLR